MDRLQLLRSRDAQAWASSQRAAQISFLRMRLLLASHAGSPPSAQGGHRVRVAEAYQEALEAIAIIERSVLVEYQREQQLRWAQPGHETVPLPEFEVDDPTDMSAFLLQTTTLACDLGASIWILRTNSAKT